MALSRGLCRMCPHCGKGPIFVGWGKTADACPVCHLVFERNAGDKWAFTVIGDRLPVAIALAVVYFGVGRTNVVLGTIAFIVTGIALLWTSPNRWGVGVALHYLSRVYLPDPSDPIPSRS